MPSSKLSAVLSQKIFASFPDSSSHSLSHLSRTLFEQQKITWRMLAEGVAALNAVQVRELHSGGYSVRLQYNPKRIVSTGAKVDAQSIRERKCFLCVNHLPEEQKGVLYREHFIVLCNPMPIFREHFTISHVDHIPQSIEENILPLLDIARDLSATHSVFYNGPRCGASAPDHMHFQASPKSHIPVEHDAADPARRVLGATRGDVKVYSLKNYGRAVIVMESSSRQDIELGFLRLAGAMRKICAEEDEPMMNVICSFEQPVWRMIVFPRAKHRPAVYFKEGDEKVLISPAAVDIGGVIVTPAEKDFHSVNSLLVEHIFSEVSVNEEILQSIITAM